MSHDELARDSDVLFVLTPGGADTWHLVNEGFLRKMKKTSVVVNTSRGTVVDSEALARALREGWIWGAGVDVVEGEPRVRRDHPLVQERRWVVRPGESEHAELMGSDAWSSRTLAAPLSKPGRTWRRLQSGISLLACVARGCRLRWT